MKSILVTLPLTAVAFSGFKDFEEVTEEQVNSTEEKLDPKTRPSKCYGLALADATYNGPYQAGALIGLLKKQQPGQEYQVITGVAMGAINGYIISLHDARDKSSIMTELCKYFST